MIFHLMVGLEAAGVKVEDVFAELRRRFGVGGHVEKAEPRQRRPPGRAVCPSLPDYTTFPRTW